MENSIEKLREKILAGGRVEYAEALALKGASIFGMARLARAGMAAMGYDGRVGYIVNRMINFSNICSSRCKFCAYHARAGVIKPFVLSDEEILKITADAEKNGAVEIMLQGGMSPEFTLEWALSLLRKIRAAHPKLFLHVFSPSEIVAFARGAKIEICECVRRLKDAGADSVPGAADILVDEIRKKVSPNKSTVAEWTEVMRALSQNGMHSSATMTFGMGETFENRLEHLFRVREIQDELGVFKAFIAWPLAPENTEMSSLPRVGAPEFLKTVALSRIILDNIKVVQSGWLTEGMKIAELATLFGANDMGGVLMDELVVKSAGVENSTTAPGMERAILRAGKKPFRRGGLYEEL
ncbi:MAG: CofH family radical SAM protein [Opitutales bacterium]|nr:CofH family radical SAM protein [Opitutales bacterium]